MLRHAMRKAQFVKHQSFLAERETIMSTRFYFVERRTMTVGDEFEYERALAHVAAMQTIARRQPDKRAQMRALVNAELSKIATINARYEV